VKGFVRVAESRWGFEIDGHPFVPVGCNYYPNDVGWAPQMWKRFDPKVFRSDFALMKDLGVNTVRLFIPAMSIQPRVGEIAETELDKIEQVVDLAESNNMRLILDGMDGWEGNPPYWFEESKEFGKVLDPYSTTEAHRALEAYWAAMCQRFGDRSAVMAWSLKNEPVICWASLSMKSRWNQWVERRYGDESSLKTAWGRVPDGKSIGNLDIPPNEGCEGDARLYDYQLFREQVAREWCKIQVNAIRQHDTNHLITVGHIQWSFPLKRPGDPSTYSAFNPQILDDILDYSSIHFYPLVGDPLSSDKAFTDNIKYLRAVVDYAYTGTPVVLEEFGWYGGGRAQQHPERTQSDQAKWNTALMQNTMDLCCGWLNWGLKDTPAATDISIFSGLADINGVPKEWGKTFRDLSGELKGRHLRRTDSKAFREFSMKQALTTANTDELLRLHVLEI